MVVGEVEWGAEGWPGCTRPIAASISAAPNLLLQRSPPVSSRMLGARRTPSMEAARRRQVLKDVRMCVSSRALGARRAPIMYAARR